MKDLRIKTITITIALATLCVAILAMLALNVWQQHDQLLERHGQNVEMAARLAGESYVTRRTQNAQLAERLSADDRIRQQAYRGSIEELQSRVYALAPLAPHEFVAVADSSGHVAVVVSPNSHFDSTDISRSLEGVSTSESRRLLTVNNSVAGVQAIPFQVRKAGYTLITGFDVRAALSGRLNAAFDGSVNVTVLSGNANPADDSVVLPLDKSNGVDLNVQLAVQQPVYSLKHPAFLPYAIKTLLILSFATLLSSLLFTRLFSKRVDQPVAAIRRAIRKIKEGRVQETVTCEVRAPFNNIAHDLESMREAICDRENRIMHHAEYDALTGLTNRSVIAEKLKMAMSRAERNGTVITALAIDLSRFSEINGSMGHEAGDEVLKEVARRLASNARVTDTVARVGGDEFFIILEDNDVKLAQSLAKFMVSSLTSAIKVNDSDIKLNVHAGVAFFPQHCDSAEALRRMANIGLYTAKEHNKSLVVYEPGQDEKHLRELAIIHDLPSAIKNNELYLQYQPKIHMETQQVKQVEALVRWRHPQLGFIPPDEFIALLEKSGMISKLTNWVFKEAVQQARAWVDAGYDLAIAVNISANDLSDDKLAQNLKRLLHHYAVDAAKITIEVTESAVIKDPENSVKVLNELRAAGVRCSLDDFGTGQTSLALLKQLPISEIKIDKSFVQNLRADSGDAIIVKSIIDLGHNMGLHVVAEGVESNYCWNLLNSYGCNLIQGYLVSAPLTADELTEWHLRLQDRHMNKLDLTFVQDMTA
ncbi:MAG: putative bifunctional diguanylate cyclase/phosphodiesterase [Gammaproteobacteria bacterium]